MGQWILGYSIFKQTHVCTMYILTYTQTCTDPHTLWEFVICVGTLESWACRRLEYPKSPGGLLQQNWSNWSNWRIDAAKLIKLEHLGQQFKPKCRYVCTTSWIWMGLRWPVPSMSPRAPCECQNDQSNNWPFVITVFTHTHTGPSGQTFLRDVAKHLSVRHETSTLK